MDMSYEAKYQELMERLKKLLKPRIGIEFEVGDFMPESQLLSQMYGNPYFEADENWPLDQVTGNPLCFIFQIVNNGRIGLDEEIALIQFFYDLKTEPWRYDEAGWLVKTYPKVDAGKMVSITKPEIPELAAVKPLTAVMKFKAEMSLPGFGDLWYFDRQLQDEMKFLETEEEDIFDVYNRMCIEAGAREMQPPSGIGGYPHWWQDGDYFQNEQGQYYEHLLEINNGILWNNFAGIYLFRNPNDKEDIKFIFQCT